MAAENGGAVSVKASTFDAQHNTIFRGNECGGRGGGLFSQRAELSFSGHSQVLNNTAGQEIICRCARLKKFVLMMHLF